MSKNAYKKAIDERAPGLWYLLNLTGHEAVLEARTLPSGVAEEFAKFAENTIIGGYDLREAGSIGVVFVGHPDEEDEEDNA